MATVLDASLLGLLAPVFAIIFVFLIVYVVLTGSKVLGDNKGIHALMAISVAFFVALSPQITRTIVFMTPWFVLMIIFIIFLFIIGKFAGMESEGILGTFGGQQGAFWWVIFFSGLILVFALSNTFGQQLLDKSGGANVTAAPGPQSAFAGNVSATLLNPEVLGLLLILIIASFTVRLMTEGPMQH